VGDHLGGSAAGPDDQPADGFTPELGRAIHSPTAPRGTAIEVIIASHMNLKRFFSIASPSARVRSRIDQATADGLLHLKCRKCKRRDASRVAMTKATRPPG